MDPASQAALAPYVIPMIIGSTAVTAYSAVEQGRQAKSQSRQQADIAARNAQMAEQQAEEQRVAAAAEAVRIEEQGEALKSRQRALYSKGGVEIKGSSLAVLVDTAAKTAADAAEVRRQGVISSISSQAQGDVMRAQGAAAKAKGAAAGRASILSATGTGLSGAAKVGYMKYQMDNA